VNIQLLVMDGKHTGRRIGLPRTQFVIGRDPSCHLRPASGEVSRLHCAIAVQAGQVRVRDLKSRNGTFLNEQRVTLSARANDGDVLQVGPLRFQIKFGPDAVPSTTNEPAPGWLLRDPDDGERRVLDPSVQTLVGRRPSVAGRSALRPSGPGNGDAVGNCPAETGAIAGEFLREYLHQQHASTVG